MYPAAHAAENPDKPAYIMADSGEVVTYGQLDERSNRCAQMLWSLGLRRGDGIAIMMENHPRFLEICWAAQRSGLYYTAISSRLTPAEVAYIVGDCGAKVMFTSAAKADVASEAAASCGGLLARLMVDQPLHGFDSYETAVARFAPEPLAEELEGADMLYSSGTTGKPKGVKIPLSGQPAGTPNTMVAFVAGLYGVGADSVYLSPAPLYHAAPLRFNMTVHRLGGTCVIMEHFDPQQALALIEKYRVTHSQWVPTMFVRMLKLDQSQRRAHDLSSLRVAVHAAAPCPIPVKQQMIEWWGPILFEYYGGTEGNGLCAITSEEWLRHKGSVGKPILGKLHIVDDDGNELPCGEPGTVYFAEGGRFEYHNDPDKTRQAHNDKGWSTLGDVGYVDEEGYLYLTDRKAFMIISGGVNIYPQEAENVLITHPKVADVAVFGVPNEDFGEEVKAVVQPMDMADAGPELERELIDFCQRQLAKIKCPRSIDFEAELPRHPTGKLYKRLLRDRYWSGRQSRIA
ncbi:MAG TPA: AMP-binding protein [Candidatus Limnocylindrales bacterium]|nr:AMP-binding protein [Candidatus Limnocylindrales bacterium]